MKVQCGVCEAAEATVVCCADEAALCNECDARIHAANKLASKHQRVPLARPPKPTHCDICQEKIAYFFCLEDRALLCHGCDMSIHLSNASTSNHRRFLVTGLTASLNTSSAPADASPSTPTSSSKPSSRNSRPQKPECSGKQTRGAAAATAAAAATSAPAAPANQADKKRELGSTSIFEFLTETVPGWRFDELTDMTSAAAAAQGFGPSKPHFELDGSFGWNSSYHICDEQMLSRSVPQMGVPPWPADSRSDKHSGSSSCSSSCLMLDQRQSIGTPTTTTTTTASTTSTVVSKNRGDFVAALLDDAFIVPDLGLQSPSVVAAAKKRRYCYSELDSIFRF